MTNNIGHSFPEQQRDHTFLSWGEIDFGRFGLHFHAGGFESRSSVLKFRIQAVSAIPTNGAANIGQSRA
jgi:hypothetical protein